jgi:hypothetical protein
LNQCASKLVGVVTNGRCRLVREGNRERNDIRVGSQKFAGTNKCNVE